MSDTREGVFDPKEFLLANGVGRTKVIIKAKQAFFTQGSTADCVFYLQSGHARVIVASNTGKEATLTLLSAGDFVGEEALLAHAGNRLATALAITSCTALRIARDEIIRVIHEEHAFSDFFVKAMLARTMRLQADLVDQLFNPSEKRLARLLLLMANFDSTGSVEERAILRLSQQTLAEMIGTTRGRVSVFMNRFHKLGLIEQNAGIVVHPSLMNVVLYDDYCEKRLLSTASPGDSEYSLRTSVWNIDQPRRTGTR